VDDVKKAVAKARKLGASVQVDYTEIGEGAGAQGGPAEFQGAHGPAGGPGSE
jgi:hypothetical protein